MELRSFLLVDNTNYHIFMCAQYQSFKDQSHLHFLDANKEEQKDQKVKDDGERGHRDDSRRRHRHDKRDKHDRHDRHDRRDRHDRHRYDIIQIRILDIASS